MRKTLGLQGLVLVVGCSSSPASPDGQGPGGSIASPGLDGSESTGNPGQIVAAGSSGSDGPSGSTGASSSPSASGAASGSSAASGSISGGTSRSGVQDAGVDGTVDVNPESNTPSDAFLPKPKGTCPTLATGYGTFAGQSVQTWVGSPKAGQHGPLLLYWHATGSNSAEAAIFFGQAQIDAITGLGGMVASFTNTVGTGTNTGNNVWYTDDFKTADEVVACAIANLHIDTRRIYTSGGSAGALQATWMAYARSGYIAAAAPISGGLTPETTGKYGDPIDMPQDPTNVPSAIAAHGAPGVDVVIVDFAQCSAAYEADIKKKGGLSVDCNNQGGHVSTPPAVSPALWTFLNDHPFKVAPDPYASGVLPSDFPAWCKVGPRAPDGGAI
jgi:hypothetical protein